MFCLRQNNCRIYCKWGALQTSSLNKNLTCGTTHSYNSWFSKRSKWTNKSFLTSGHVHCDYRFKAWMTCVFFIVNLIKVTYLTIYQFEHLVKLNKKWPPLSKWPMAELINSKTFNQVGQSKMTSLIKMDNGVLIKWDILC
jgi:hypothetical protein